jgi:hypothetical protein
MMMAMTMTAVVVLKGDCGRTESDQLFCVPARANEKYDISSPQTGELQSVRACDIAVQRYMTTSPYTSNKFFKASFSTFEEHEGLSPLM